MTESLAIIRAFWPLFVLQLILTVWAVIDIAARKETRLFPKYLWFIISIAVPNIGPLIYFFTGRG